MFSIFKSRRSLPLQSLFYACMIVFALVYAGTGISIFSSKKAFAQYQSSQETAPGFPYGSAQSSVPVPSQGSPSTSPSLPNVPGIYGGSAPRQPGSFSRNQDNAPSQETVFIAPLPGEAVSYESYPASNFEEEKTEEELEEEARREAFDAALQGLLPLRPEEIRELLEHFDRTQESVELPVYPYPKPEVAVETISLEPGAMPAKIKVAYGHVTTITILDVTGQPWPIENVTWAGNFEVIDSSAGAGVREDNSTPETDETTGRPKGTHIIRVSPESEFAYGNISINLVHFNTPVILTLETSRDIVHYRFDAIIPEYGPHGQAPIIETGLTIQAGENKDIAGVLVGSVPKTAQKLNVNGVDGRTTAYRYNDSTFVRTPLTLLSPGWSSSLSSADGMNVYEIKNTPVILLSENGQMVRAHLSDREEFFDE